MTEPDTAWMGQAACAGKDTNLWFPEAGENPRHAKTVCGECPVTADCLAWAITNDERYGYWGGLGPKKRAKMRTATPAPHVQQRRASQRRQQVAAMTADGHTDTEIAEALGITRSAVSYHRVAINKHRGASA